MMSDTGTKISEFEEFSQSNDIENKILLVLEPQDNGVKHYKDRYITFKNFEKNIINDFTTYEGFGDMVYQNKENYSKYNHVHDEYSKLSVVINDEFEDNLKIASITVDNKNYDIHQNFDIPNYKRKTEIGELKFVAIQNINTNIDIYSEDFDGWVYANGKRYQTKIATDFQQAKDNFITSKDGLTFTVPKLKNFIKPSIEPLTYEEKYDSAISSNTLTNIPYHTHNVKFQIEDNVKTAIDTKSTLNKDGKDILFTRARDDKGTTKISVPSILHIDKLQLEHMNTYEEGQTSGETYPRHNLLPVMIYIGQRT